MVLFGHEAVGVERDEGDGLVVAAVAWRHPLLRNVRALPEAEIKDDRTVAEKAWEDAWVGSFDLAHAGKAPVLYLFSTRNPASRILQKSADVSGGKFTLIDWLRPDGPPKPGN